MAERYYSANVGAGMPGSVTEGGSATPGATYDFRVTYDATGNSKVQTIRALEAILQAIAVETWPPI